MTFHANQPPGRSVVAAVATAPARSSTSMSDMLATAPSNGRPSHQPVVQTSAST